jgi:hypothetical protein
MVDKAEFERHFWFCYDRLHAAATPEIGVPGYFRFMTLLGGCFGGLLSMLGGVPPLYATFLVGGWVLWMVAWVGQCRANSGT